MTGQPYAINNKFIFNMVLIDKCNKGQYYMYYKVSKYYNMTKPLGEETR